MRPVKRYSVHKGSSAKKFNRNSKRANVGNFANPMRGGIRL